MTRELLLRITLKDFDRSDIRGSGPGGQHRNKTSTGIRLRHRASGAVGEATDSKSQQANLRAAWRRCIETPEFKLWLRFAIATASGEPTTQERLLKAMDEKNILTQVLHDDAWVTVDVSDLRGDE